MHPPPNADGNGPYVSSLHVALERAGVRVLPASIRNARAHPVAPLHIQWPEHLLRHRSLAGRIAKLGVASFLLAQSKRTGRQVVWTAHNLVPHGGWRPGEARFFRLLQRRITLIILLCSGQEFELLATYPGLAGAELTVIPSGQLHDLPRNFVVSPRTGPVRVLHLGAIGPYKGQIDVIKGLTPQLEAGKVELTVAGAPHDSEYSARVRHLGRDVDGLTVLDRRVPESELFALIAETDLAIGIQREGFNTGVVAAMVPLGVPVALSPGSQFNYYEDELGTGWVASLADPTGAWDEIIDWASHERPDPPLDHFDWDRLARLHKAAYQP